MPIRNLWSLECGEIVTAEALLRNVKGCEVYFPVRDIGIDLLAVKGKKHVSIQVKESRYYPQRISWHVIFRKKFVKEKEKERVDFYVFVTYFPKCGENKMSIENKFVIVPTPELDKIVNGKKVDKRGRYFFCFDFEENKVIDKRNSPQVDYSEYFNRWDLIKEALDSKNVKNSKI